MAFEGARSYFRSLAVKVFRTAMLPVALFLALIAAYMLPTVHTLLLDSKKEGLRHVVESAHSQVAIAPRLCTPSGFNHAALKCA